MTLVLMFYTKQREKSPHHSRRFLEVSWCTQTFSAFSHPPHLKRVFFHLLWSKNIHKSVTGVRSLFITQNS